MIYLSIAFLAANFIAAAAIWRADSKGRLVITPLLFFSAYEMIQVWPSAVYADQNGITPSVNATIVIGLSYTFFLVGFVAVRFSTYWQKQMGFGRFSRIPPGSVLQLPSASAYWVGFLALGVLLAAVSLYFYRGMPPVANFYLGNVTDVFVSEARKALTKSHIFGGQYRGQGLFSTLMGIGWPMLFLMSAILYRLKRTTFWLLTMAAYGAAMVIFVAGDGSRSPLLLAIIFVVISISIVRPVKVRSLAIFVAALLALAIGLSVAPGRLDKENTSALDNLAQIGTRVSLDDGLNSMHVLEFVNNGTLDLQMGGVHVQKFILALPGSLGGIPFSRKISELLNKQSETSFSSTTYVATVYVDFGLPGVIIVYFVLGCFFGLSHLWIYATKRLTPINVTLLGMTVLQMGQISNWGVVGFLSNYIVVLLLLFIVVVSKDFFVLALGRNRRPGKSHFALKRTA